MDFLSLLIKYGLYSIIIYLSFFLYKYFNSLYIISKINGPKRHPIYGNLPNLICDSEELFLKLRKWGQKYYPVYSIMSVPVVSVNIVGPDDIELLLSSTKHSTKSQIYQMLHNWLKEGLLTSAGAKWQQRRKLLTPAFHFNILQEFISIFYKETNRLVDDLQESCNESFVDVVPIITQFTLYTINETSMGTTLDLTKQEDIQYRDSILQIGSIFLYRVIRPHLIFFWVYKLLCPKKASKEIAITKILHNFTNNVILSKIKSSENVNSDQNSYSQRKRLAMLDLLINMKNEGLIDIDGIREEVDTFMFEGHDTTSMALSFILMILACNRNEQDLIVEEIHDIIGDLNEEPTYQNLNDLKYMELCIKESLRLFPSVPMISRITDEDITTSTGNIIPKGTITSVHIYDVHRIPSIYPDPEKFNPDRFLPENTLNRHPFAYIPFSAGPRNCIGQKFAMLELKTALIGILKNFILEPVDTPETVVIIPDIVLRPRDGIKVKFTKRI